MEGGGGAGQLLAYIINAIIAISFGHDPSIWRYLLVIIIAKPGRPRQNECAQSRPNLHNVRSRFLCSLQDCAHIRRIFRNQIQNL